MKTILGWVGCALIASLGLMGCSGYAPDAPAEEEVGSMHDELWTTGAIWPNGTVPVCFDSALTSSFRQAIQTAINNGWENIPNINFTGWGTCPSPVPLRTVVVKKGNPLMNAGAWVQFTPNLTTNSAPLIGYNASKTSFVEFQSVAANPSTGLILHEFGHVLGFLHEMQNENPLNCAERTTGTKVSDSGVNDVANSIMASTYCQQVQVLSAQDIKGASRRYARDADGQSTVHTYNTDPSNAEGPPLIQGNTVQCPGANDVLVGIEQWDYFSHTIQCAQSAYGWASDFAGRRYGWSSPNLLQNGLASCPENYVAIGVDFTTNLLYCSAVSGGYGGPGTVSDSNQYGHFNYYGTSTEIHNCPVGKAIHAGNVAFNKPVNNQYWRFGCVE